METTRYIRLGNASAGGQTRPAISDGARMSGPVNSKWMAAAAALAMTASGPASAALNARSSAPTYSPWVMMSAMASQGSSSALCAASASAASAAAAQGAATGCVLPQVDAPVPVAQAPVEAPLGTSLVAPAASTGIGFLPILLGLVALAGVAALVLSQNGSDNARVRLPNSPR